jgi:hypothetical protein
MSGENPYAPPETMSSGVPDAPESFGWELVGKKVWVEKSSQLPMVDPLSGTTNEVMTMTHLVVRQRPSWILAITWIVWAFLLVTMLGDLNRNLKSNFVAVGSVVCLVSLLIGLFFPTCSLYVFVDQKKARARKSIGFLIALWIGMTGLKPFKIHLIWGLIWAVGLVALQFINPRLTCRRHKDGRFEIRGFHPRALELLALAQQNGTLPCNEGPIPEDQQTDRSHGTHL